MPAATAPEVMDALADVIKQDVGSLAGYWAGHCQRASAFAYQEARDGLLSRGFLIAHVTGWDRLFEFTVELAVWKALHLGGAYDAVPKETLEGLDRREDLKSVLVYVNGIWIKPVGDQPGLAASAGPTVAQNSGVFRFDDGPDAWPDYGIRV